MKTTKQTLTRKTAFRFKNANVNSAANKPSGEPTTTLITTTNPTLSNNCN